MIVPIKGEQNRIKMYSKKATNPNCKDDPVIDFKNSQKAVEKLRSENIPCKFKSVEYGGHGFGLGDYNEAAGWLYDAVSFWEKE